MYVKMEKNYPPPPTGMTYHDYLAAFPDIPTAILKKHFPKLKRHDISNFIKDHPYKDEFQNRGGPNGLTILDENKTKDNIVNYLEDFCKKEFNITRENFEQGLDSKKVKEIIKFVISKSENKEELGWMSERYLSKEVNKIRKEKGHTLFYTYLCEFYPGKELLDLSHFHPYFFNQTVATKCNMDDLLEALKIYYENHHNTMLQIKELFKNTKPDPDFTEEDRINDCWQYFKRSWRRGGSKINKSFINMREEDGLIDFGLGANIFKFAVEKYLKKLYDGNEEDKKIERYLRKTYTSVLKNGNQKFNSTHCVHDLLEKKQCNLSFETEPQEAWNRHKFLAKYPNFSLKCVGCGETRYSCIDLHHIIERCEHPERTYDEDNVIAVCAHIHRMISNRSYKHQEYLNAVDIFNKTKDRSKLDEWISEAHKIPGSD
tara:strand:- start:256 stop:1545 length:1290 start_codon:yes stop_codon:yes gene_type:complete